MEGQPAQPAADPGRRRVLAGLGVLAVGAAGGTVALVRLTASGRPPSTPPARATSTPPTSGVDDSALEGTTSTTPAPAPASTQARAGTTVTHPDATDGARSSVSVVCREAWGADPAGAGLLEHTPVRLTIHHSAVAQTAPSQGPERVRRHQRYHQGLGWPDLAYHFVVDRLGVAYEGRDPRFRGDTGTEYDPAGHFLVCLEGEFDSQQPTEAQLTTAAGLFGWASATFGIDPSTIAGHSAYASTGCPGASVEEMLAGGSLEEAIRAAGGAEVERLCGERGAVEVARIETLQH